MEYINRLLRKGGSKKSDTVGHQLPGEKREFAEENDFSQCQQSTPVKHFDCDTESDTTAEYESAGEASPWEKPSNISALADYLAGVHLSTPDKIHTELTYFPFSPISAEDECDDEVTAIISNGSQSSSHTLSFHEREEISVSKQDKTTSNLANTSFSDVDPEEFKNSVPCKRHSETNISSFLHSETLQFSDEGFGRVNYSSKGGVNFETEMSCSIEEKKLKTPPPSLNESEDITSSIVESVEALCDSVNNKVTSSETMSPKGYDTLNLSGSDKVIENNTKDPITTFADNERKLVEQSPSATYLPFSNKSPVPVYSEKCATSLDSLEDDVTIISEMESSSNALQTSRLNDYVNTTKHKIDTIFSSKKEIVSNVICETKQQIDNMFKSKSPIKELASNTVSHVIGSIKNLNTTESDSSPQKNVIIEKISSPVSSAKQKIDSLFSPKKAMDKEVLENTSLSEVSVVNELTKNELLQKDNNESNQNNSSFNTVIVEHLDLDTSKSGLSVVSLQTSSESYEVIETSKQQIDKIFKSLSPSKVAFQNEVLELSNSTMSTDLDLEEEICITSPISGGFERTRSKQSTKEFSVAEPLKSSNDLIFSDKQKTDINEVVKLCSKKESGLSSVLNEGDKSHVLESLDETYKISKVALPVDSEPKLEDNASSDLLVSNRTLTNSTSNEIFNQTTSDEVINTMHQGDIVTVRGSYKKSEHGADEEQVMEDSISHNSIKSDEQHLSDYQSTIEVFSKDTIEASRTFHVISPKKESLNISLSAILDKKELPSKIAANESTLVITNVPEDHSQATDSSIHSKTLSITPCLDQSVLIMEQEELVVSDSQNISPLELSQVIDGNVVGTNDSVPKFSHESTEHLDLQVSLKSVGNSDEEKLQSSAIEEAIDNKMVCEEPNDGHDSHLMPQQEPLHITAVDQMALKKEEVEDFVVVDVAELEKPVSPQLLPSDFQEKDVSDILQSSSQYDIEKKLNEAKGRNAQDNASILSSAEMIENEVQMEPTSPLKESVKDNAEVMVNDMVKQGNTEHIKENVEPVIIPECGSVADVINIQDNEKCSSLEISSVDVRSNLSDAFSVGGQLNLELEKKVEPTANIIEKTLTSNDMVVGEITGVNVHTEEKVGVKELEVHENLPLLNDVSNFNKKIDDSVFIQSDTEQRLSNSFNSYTSGACHLNIALGERTTASDINTLQNDEHVNVNLKTIPNSSFKEDEKSFGTSHNPLLEQIQSEPNQGQTYPDESIYLTSEIIEGITLAQFLSQIPSKYVAVKPELSDDDTTMKNIIEANAVVNESVVSNNETYKPSTNERRSPAVTEATNNLFSEIFQHGKDQMCSITTKYSENKQSKSEVLVTQEESKQIIEQNCNTSNFIPSHDSEFLKNSGFSSEHVFSDKVKSPPFACPVSSDSIAFGSPSEYSLSLSPIDSFTGSTKISNGNSTSTVSCNKICSSSAEIGMGLKSSPESLEIIKSDISNQNNELSPPPQTPLQIQGEMSTRNEKYSYTFNKSSKDFRGSPVNKNSEKEFSSLCDNFRTFKLDDLSKSTIERKSYEDLLDRCLEQERLLGFDETIKEEADKLIKEIANASSDDICIQPDEFPPANANNSEAGPVTADEDLNKADLFQDATLFDFDFLSKIGKGKPSRRLVRESLFLKFDPLAAAAAAVATPEPAQEMAQVDSSSDVTSTPPRAPPLINGDDKLVSITPNDEATCSPASSTVATPPRSKARTSSCSATPTLRHEILSKEISKLQDLMMRQESSYQEQIAARTEEVEQLREQLAELEARDNQVDLQGQLNATEAEAAKLRKELVEATESKKQLMMIMEEYEKTISQVVTMREDDKKKFEMEKEQISMEREGALVHLRNMEIAFNDVHQKYEKCKEVIEAFKHNEEQYKISLNENRKTIIQQEENYQKLKEHAAQKLEQANIEISEMKKAHQAEIAKMVAVQRKMEIRVKSLEESLEQKKREAAELTKICDDLITKVEQ